MYTTFAGIHFTSHNSKAEHTPWFLFSNCDCAVTWRATSFHFFLDSSRRLLLPVILSNSFISYMERKVQNFNKIIASNLSTLLQKWELFKYTFYVHWLFQGCLFRLVFLNSVAKILVSLSNETTPSQLEKSGLLGVWVIPGLFLLRPEYTMQLCCVQLVVCNKSLRVL